MKPWLIQFVRISIGRGRSRHQNRSLSNTQSVTCNARDIWRTTIRVVSTGILIAGMVGTDRLREASHRATSRSWICRLRHGPVRRWPGHRRSRSGRQTGGREEGSARVARRAAAALEILKSQERTNPEQLAAIGYCFGGTTVLELARAGADVKGVVSFHGDLSTPNLKDAENIKGAGADLSRRGRQVRIAAADR